MESSRSSSPEPWTPEPLVPDVQCEINEHIVTSRPGKLITVDGQLCLNAATNDYLNLSEAQQLEEASIDTVKKYGVGSCGPRAFYGTMDVHLELEKAIAEFLNVQEAVLYSFGFSTIASAIPAYAKASDIVLYDEQCNFAIQKGIVASRSQAIKFKHNDVEDLDKKLDEVTRGYLKKHGKSKLPRTFLIIESIYAKTGDMCPLRELVEVAKRHKTRVFMDESRSFGVLGAGGRGITQYLNVDVDEIDLIMVSLENALCSYGGFCAGTTYIIDHQRLAGTGYCFSASLPPFQCSAALQSLKIIEENPSLVKKAQELFAYANEKLSNLTLLKNLSHPLSPIKIIVIKPPPEDTDDDDPEEPEFIKEDERKLSNMCEDILSNEQIALTVARYLEDEEATSPIASIRLTINAGMSRGDIDRIFAALERSSAVELEVKETI